MQLYTSEEEYNQLRVLMTVFSNNDFFRLKDAALNVLQKNPDNPIANIIYHLDISTRDAGYGIKLYIFNADRFNKLLNNIISAPPIDDNEGMKIVFALLANLICLCSWSSAWDISIEPTLNLIFECVNACNAGVEFRTKIYKSAIDMFCGENSFLALRRRRNAAWFSIHPEETRRLACIKKNILNDTELDSDVKNSLIAQLNTAMKPPIQPAPQSQPQQSHTTRNIVIGVIAVVCVIIFFLSLL